LELIVMLLVLLITARLAGEVAERLGQPAIAGELLAGILLGPTLFNLLDPLSMAAGDPVKITLDVLTTLAIFFVVFHAGLEMSVDEFYDAIKGKGMYFAMGSFIVTFLIGFVTGFYFLQTYTGAAVMGLCISITALPVSVKILSDLGKLHTKTGHAIIGTAMVHDIISITVLGVIIGLNVTTGSSDPFAMAMMLLKIAFFMLLVFTLERSFHVKDGWLAKKFTGFMDRIKSKEAQFSIGVITAMYFAVIAEFLGLSYIIGAFYGGLIFSTATVGKENFAAMKRGTSGIAMGFFAPIFIAYLGLMFNLRELAPIFWLFAVILVVSIVSMFSSGYLGARMAGYSDKEALIVGVGINARGMMEMVVALMAYKAGFIDQNFLSVLVGMALVTTLVTPTILRWLYKRLPEETAPPGLHEQNELEELRAWLTR